MAHGEKIEQREAVQEVVKDTSMPGGKT